MWYHCIITEQLNTLKGKSYTAIFFLIHELTAPMIVHCRSDWKWKGERHSSHLNRMASFALLDPRPQMSVASYGFEALWSHEDTANLFYCITQKAKVIHFILQSMVHSPLQNQNMPEKYINYICLGCRWFSEVMLRLTAEHVTLSCVHTV